MPKVKQLIAAAAAAAATQQQQLLQRQQQVCAYKLCYLLAPIGAGQFCYPRW